QGEIITCHDSDDWSHPQKLEKQVAFLKGNTSLAATDSQLLRLSDGVIPLLRHGVKFIHQNPSSLMFYRHLLRSVGYYDCVRFGADNEFRARISARFGGGAVQEQPLCLAFARERSDSLTNAPGSS